MQDKISLLKSCLLAGSDQGPKGIRDPSIQGVEALLHMIGSDMGFERVRDTFGEISLP